MKIVQIKRLRPTQVTEEEEVRVRKLIAPADEHEVPIH
jgi:hypothetical protein